jgi:hypothetical protein
VNQYIKLIAPVGTNPAGAILLTGYEHAHYLISSAKATVLGFEDEIADPRESIKIDKEAGTRAAKTDKKANSRSVK